jgi:hypothetical protein
LRWISEDFLDLMSAILRISTIMSLLLAAAAGLAASADAD